MIFQNNKYLENGSRIKKIRHDDDYSYLNISQDSTAIIKQLRKKERNKERPLKRLPDIAPL